MSQYIRIKTVLIFYIKGLILIIKLNYGVLIFKKLYNYNKFEGNVQGASCQISLVVKFNLLLLHNPLQAL